VGKAFFAPDEGEDFFFRIEVNAEALSVPLRHRSPELEHA